MKVVKKSFNMTGDMAQKIEDFIQRNPGVSFTLMMNQALQKWLERPAIALNRTEFSDDDATRFLDENAELMDNLAGDHPSERNNRRPSRRAKS